MAKSHRQFNAHPFRYHAELELEITTLTNLGLGLGRVTLPADGKSEVRGAKSEVASSPSAHATVVERPATADLDVRAGEPMPELRTSDLAPPTSSWVVMVPFALPGERVRVRVFRNHKNYSEADVVAVLRASPHRVAAPPCPLFGRCGGCQYQHLTYAEQLTWKRQQVEELLRHMAGLEFHVAPVIGSPREYGYRSKITPHFAPPRAAAAAAAAEIPKAKSQIPKDGAGPAGPEGAGGIGAGQRAAAAPAGADSADRSTSNQHLSTAAVAAACPIGFLRQGTRFDLVDVPRCLIATDAINARLPAARAAIHARAAAGDIKRNGTLLLREASGLVTSDYDAEIEEIVAVPPPRGAAETLNVQRPMSIAQGPGAGAADVGTAEDPGSGDSVGSAFSVERSALKVGAGATPALRLRFLARDFFQNNPFILPAFVGYVRDQAVATGARFLVDAYCGSGLFALGAARSFERVAGVEISATSVAFAQRNATLNGLANATFLAGDAAAIFAGLTFPATDTVVVIDPPRKGCDESFLTQLFAYGPRAVVYVSCDPATQMRDLRHFTTAGYHLTAVQPFDLFPQTRHLECVVTLVRG